MIDGLVYSDLGDDERFHDLLAAIIEGLVRTRSMGAFKTAEALKDKYLDPGINVAEYGEQFIKTTTLASAKRGN